MKIGFLCDLFGCISVLYWCWFEFFDFDVGVLVEVESECDVCDLEL